MLPAPSSLTLLRLGDSAPVAAVGQTQPGGHPAPPPRRPDEGLQGAGSGHTARLQSERPGGGRA